MFHDRVGTVCPRPDSDTQLVEYHSHIVSMHPFRIE